ncbi:thioredoxin-like protein yls8 [Quercus suber]|uniref:Thioredoxin-like protein yls8 n=1 Tax=Quercus suber TaxID=58331 RepID=A0AAW0INA5_QUESU
MSSYHQRQEVDAIIRDTIDKVLDFLCSALAALQIPSASNLMTLNFEACELNLFLSTQLSKSAREVSKFASVALVDIDSDEIQYFDITFIPSTVFFFNAHHMKMDSGTADHTKWVDAFHRKQDFIDVVEAIYRGAMKGKLIVSCPLPPQRIPKYQLLYKDV